MKTNETFEEWWGNKFTIPISHNNTILERIIWDHQQEKIDKMITPLDPIIIQLKDNKIKNLHQKLKERDKIKCRYCLHYVRRINDQDWCYFHNLKLIKNGEGYCSWFKEKK